MNSTSRSWVITTIAVVTILLSISPLSGALAMVVRSRGDVLANPLFLSVLTLSVVTTVSGIGLLMRKPWSRFGFALTAIGRF